LAAAAGAVGTDEQQTQMTAPASGVSVGLASGGGGLEGVGGGEGELHLHEGFIGRQLLLESQEIERQLHPQGGAAAAGIDVQGEEQLQES
jgi:hypothetical protein